MESYTKKYKIAASIDDVWQALTDDNLMEKWGAGPANFEAKEGGKFNMWGDYLTGKNLVYDEARRLEQDWLAKGLEEPPKVSFELSETGDTTTVELTHSKVPKDMVQEFSDGWDDHYMGPLKDYLEN